MRFLKICAGQPIVFFSSNALVISAKNYTLDGKGGRPLVVEFRTGEPRIVTDNAWSVKFFLKNL